MTGQKKISEEKGSSIQKGQIAMEFKESATTRVAQIEAQPQKMGL